MSETTETVFEYAQALVAALRTCGVLESRAGWFERLLMRLLRATYRQRLRVIIEAVPGDVGDRILKGDEVK